MRIFMILLMMFFFAMGAAALVYTLGNLLSFMGNEHMTYKLFENGSLLRGNEILLMIGIEFVIAFSLLFVAYKINKITKKL